MLILIWIFLVGSIVIMLVDMMLEEWAGMDVIQGGAAVVRWARQKWFSKGKAAVKGAVKAKAPLKIKAKVVLKKKKK